MHHLQPLVIFTSWIYHSVSTRGAEMEALIRPNKPFPFQPCEMLHEPFFLIYIFCWSTLQQSVFIDLEGVFWQLRQRKCVFLYECVLQRKLSVILVFVSLTSLWFIQAVLWFDSLKKLQQQTGHMKQSQVCRIKFRRSIESNTADRRMHFSTNVELFVLITLVFNFQKKKKKKNPGSKGTISQFWEHWCAICVRGRPWYVALTDRSSFWDCVGVDVLVFPTYWLPKYSFY